MKSGRVLALFSIAILIVIGYRFDQYVLQKNYRVDAHTVCDPKTERCFAADCSSGSDPECDPTPYKKVQVRAAEAPACLLENNCDSFSCTTSSCKTLYCDDSTLEDGEVCTSSQ